MPKVEGAKYRSLLVAKCLMENCDENNPVWMNDILDYLESECNITADRRSVYRDIEALRSELGMKIEEEKVGRDYRYRLLSRPLDFDDLLTLNNAKQKEDRLSVPMYSDFFSSLTDNVMCSNNMYDSLQKEIESTLSVYSEKKSVTLAVYESSSSSADTKESVVIGFRKYIAQCLDRAKASLKMHLLTFTFLAAVAVGIEYLVYGVYSDYLAIWVQNSLNIVAWVFGWQFAVYMTFEFFKEIKAIRRLDQILNIEFVFNHWE